MAALLGMLTGIGGGVMRDLLLTRVPVVFQSDIYALAALAGASVVVLGDWLHWPAMPTAIAGALLCFACAFSPCGSTGTCRARATRAALTRIDRTILLSFGA